MYKANAKWALIFNWDILLHVERERARSGCTCLIMHFLITRSGGEGERGRGRRVWTLLTAWATSGGREGGESMAFLLSRWLKEKRERRAAIDKG